MPRSGFSSIDRARHSRRHRRYSHGGLPVRDCAIASRERRDVPVRRQISGMVIGSSSASAMISSNRGMILVWHPTVAPSGWEIPDSPSRRSASRKALCSAVRVAGVSIRDPSPRANVVRLSLRCLRDARDAHP